MDRTECVVVGAGVIGLACARRMAMAGSEVVILEAADAIGTGMSSRSNEVVHAGIYFRPGSPEAALCVPGRDAVFGYCARRGVGVKRIGKLVVATIEAPHHRRQSLPPMQRRGIDPARAHRQNRRRLVAVRRIAPIHHSHVRRP